MVGTILAIGFLIVLGAAQALFAPATSPLPRPPEAGWENYLERAGKSTLTLSLPDSWQIVDATHMPEATAIAALRAAGNPLGDHLQSMSEGVSSGAYVLQAINPATVSSSVPFAVSAYLAHVPGYAKGKDPKALWVENLAATKYRYKLSFDPVSRSMTPPRGFDAAWEVEYAWAATQDGTGASAQLAGIHYLLIAGDDAWILGFTAMRADGVEALSTWRRIAGGMILR